MRRPKHTFPMGPNEIPHMTPDRLPNPILDPLSFEEIIRNRGLRWKLQKAAYCPNVRDLNTQQHDSSCNKCENGFIYFGGYEIHGTFMANKLERMYEILGVWDIGEAVLTFSAYQDGPNGEPGLGAPIDVMPFDRLTCLDYTFRWQELIEHSPSGLDRLRYPALTVEFLATNAKRYFPDQDFTVNSEGMILWKGQDQPTFDQLNNRGEIFTITYTAQPVFIVVTLLHEIRATKGLDPLTGEYSAIQLPQQVLVRRDYLFAHPFDKKGMSTTRTPRSGGNVVPE